MHDDALTWINQSKEAGKQWAVAVDEPGNARHALITDAEDPEHNDARINGLWGAFMAGAWGTEWYFGYEHPHSDLTCEDYASRDLFWDQCRYLIRFFEDHEIPFWEAENVDHLVSEGDYCLGAKGRFYVVYLKEGQGAINLSGEQDPFDVRWYNPRTGGELLSTSQKRLKGGKKHTLKAPLQNPSKDWVVFLSKS